MRFACPPCWCFSGLVHDNRAAEAGRGFNPSANGLMKSLKRRPTAQLIAEIEPCAGAHDQACVIDRLFWANVGWRFGNRYSSCRAARLSPSHST